MFLGPILVSSQWASKSVQPFLHSLPERPTHADTQTTLRATSVAICRNLCTVCRRCDLIKHQN